ncbi:MAG: response regulator, partial [Chloroflexi bacterium]|nr:response regulator [Chloroflexota bacterium]
MNAIRSRSKKRPNGRNESAARPRTAEKRKILVVDDDRFVIAIVTRALKDLDLEVISADTASRGAELLRKEGPRLDVCLLDIMLPDTSGIEACTEYRAIDSTLPIIFITSDDSSATAIEATKMGAYDHVLKPLKVLELKAIVEKAREVRRKMLVPVEMT